MLHLENICTFWGFSPVHRPKIKKNKIVNFIYKKNNRSEQSMAVSKIAEDTKGQLNSKWIYEVIVSPKMQTKTSALPNK